MVRAIGLWLRQRSFYVQLDQQRSTTRPMTNGLPQGSPLSVLLWHVYVSDMPVDVDRSALFMDDTVIWADGADDWEVRSKLQRELTKIQFWCSIMKVRINSTKTKFMLNEIPLFRTFRLYIDGDAIVPSQEVKYLGVNGGGHLGAVVKYPSFEPKVARSIPDPPTFVMKFPRNFRNQGPSIEVQLKLTHPKILD